MRLEPADVAKQLKLSLAQVNALEADAYDELPGPVFVKGFIRNYARFVRLDAESLIARLPGAPTVEVREVNTVDEMPVPGEGRSWKRYGIAAGVIVVALAIYEFIFNNEEPASPPAAHAPAPAAPAEAETAANAPAQPGVTPASTVEAVPPPSVPPTQVQPAAPTQPVAPAVSQPTSSVPVPLQPVVVGTATQASVPAATPGPVAAPTPAPVTVAPGDAVLRMSFERDCWVEVRDSAGRIVFSQLNRAGSQHEVAARPPLTMTLGAARGVKLSYNGKPVDLSPYTKIDVARLTLP